MKIRTIPVIDIKDGIAVKAVRGERDSYKPLSTRVCGSCEPADVARAYKLMGFQEVYVADLDAITGKGVDYSRLEPVKESGLNVMADIGVKTMEQVRQLDSIGVTPIIGSESLESMGFLNEASRYKIIFSIDTKKGVLMNKLDMNLDRLFDELKSYDRITEYILLDLADVGTEGGPNVKLCEKAVGRLDSIVIYGGGIRNSADVTKLLEMGISGVLVGSAIHSGRITSLDVKKLLSS
ncbi:MAG: HisA/HisF-related TIM barrel protein [Candidatus Altiarchaeota archaeon]|nr:HisA/HisF-related TIM barrel protein [Candidatus Altiarchaeota archaeon]